jgi:hypothetical protein
VGKLNDAKILLWDVETLPSIAFAWGMWKQNIAGHQIIKPGNSLICISYKWLNSTKVYTISAGDDKRLFAKDPYACSGGVAERFIPILNKADFAVAHNGDKFDYRILKAQSVINNLPSFRVRKVDTLKMAKSIGMFPKGNKLDNLADVLGVEMKNKTNFQMWADIAMRSDRAQLDKMVNYCEQDVRVLEQVFMKLWPHCETMLPNIHTLAGGGRTVVACDRCGSESFVKNGRYIKNVLVYQRHLCNQCGTTFLGRKAIDITK